MFGHGLYGSGGPVVMIIFWVAIIAAFVYLARIIPWGGSQVTADHGPSAQEILQRRYAAGEISREEYDRMRRDISS